MAKSFYETLGVPRTATEKDIRNAYRKLARQHHPDVNPGDKAAEARFKEINAANDVLSDADKRKKYDKYGDRWEQAEQYEEMERRQSPGNWARNGPGQQSYTFEAGDGGDFGSIFDNLFRRERGGPRGRPATRRGQDVETPVEVSLEEAFRGTTRTVALQTTESCAVCGGTGEVAGSVCQTCDGQGQVARTKRLEVRVPAGVRTGSRVRVAGEGRPGTGGGSTGDLYLTVTVQANNRFERKGDDLHVEVPASYIDAVLGGEVEVPTIDGRLMLKLPALTQNGRQLKLTGKGMPVLGGTGRGDLYAKIRIQLPEALSDDERTLFEQLRAQRERKQVGSHGE
jgi:DnaJ-class molecular chaperone